MCDVITPLTNAAAPPNMVLTSSHYVVAPDETATVTFQATANTLGSGVGTLVLNNTATAAFAGVADDHEQHRDSHRRQPAVVQGHGLFRQGQQRQPQRRRPGDRRDDVGQAGPGQRQRHQGGGRRPGHRHLHDSPGARGHLQRRHRRQQHPDRHHADRTRDVEQRDTGHRRTHWRRLARRRRGRRDRSRLRSHPQRRPRTRPRPSVRRPPTSEGRSRTPSR